MQLYQFDYNSNGYHLDLTPASLSELTGIDENRIAGMFGGGLIGAIDVMHDEDRYWQDVMGDMDECSQALFIEPGRQADNYTCTDLYDERNPKLEKIADAIKRLWGGEYRYSTADEHRVLHRYAKLLGFEVEFRTLTGGSPSDWLDVIAVHPIGDGENFVLDEMSKYWAGEVYGYNIELESPLGGALEDSCWGFVGDEYVLQEVVSTLEWMVGQISTGIREAKAA